MTITFARFRRAVDSAVCAIAGIGLDDLPDTITPENYWEEDLDIDADEWRTLAKACALDILQEEGFPLSVLEEER
jgi:hypothetical protein